jgi:probable RNA-binding protein EIF1AD
MGPGLTAPCRPSKFAKNTYGEDDEDEDSTVGKMPPSDSEEEGS